MLSCQDVRAFDRQRGIAAPDSALIESLVAEHLSMSWVAQRSDLSNPQGIAALAQRVGSERHLTALYSLTVADIRSTRLKV